MTEPARTWSAPLLRWWLCWTAALVFLCLPGSPRSPFSGLPLSSKALLLFAGLVILGFASLLFRPRRSVHAAIPIALLAAVALKLVLAPMLVPAGWRGEYHHARRAMDKTYTPFARAYFQDGLVARPYRVDRAIDFAAVNFGLTFVNDAHPDPPDYSPYQRDEGHPLVVRWTGHLAKPAGTPLSTTISARGVVVVRVNGREIFRAHHPRSQPLSWVTQSGSDTIQVVYAKRPGSIPAISVAPFADVTAVPATAEAIRTTTLAGHALNGLGLLTLALLGLALFQAYRPLPKFVLDDIWLEPDKIAVLAAFTLFFAWGIMHAIPRRHSTMQLGIGDDPLRYEGASREILRHGLLMLPDTGLAQPYYHYPLYSYVLAAAHVVFGDDYATILILNWLCTAFVFVLVWLILRNRLARGSIIIVLLLLVPFAKLHLLRWAEQPFTDNLYVPAVLAVILATVYAFETRKSAWLFVVGLLTALGAATRPSMLLHLPVMAVAVLLYRDFGSFLKRVGGSLAFTFGFFAGVAPFTLRNWIVSKRFVLLVASFIMLPYFMYGPEETRPSFLIDGNVPTGTQAIMQAWDTFAARPLQVTWVEIRKVLFTFGITAVGPAGIDWWPWIFPIFPILFGVALYTRRVDRPVKAALLIFCASHLIAMVVGAPWTYGYKTILPFHMAAIIGAAFLLPRRNELISVAAARQVREPRPSKGKKISVILPTYNEKDSIRQCIEDFFATGIVDEVLVINNNAAPGTSEEVAGTGAVEIFERRQGYGSAIQRGLREAKGDYLVVCEPDGTFMARDLHKLLAYADDFDVVYGSRTSQQFVWKGANMGMFLRWGNWAVAKYLEFLYNATSLTDVGCTMRLVRRDAAEMLLPLFRIHGSQFGPEMMILSLREGLDVVQIPVNYLPRVGESSVTGDPAKAFRLGLQMVWLITTYRFHHLKPAQGIPGDRRRPGEST